MDFFNDFAEEQGEEDEDMINELEAEIAGEEMEDDVPDAPISGGMAYENSTAAAAAKEEEDLLAELN